MKTILAVVEKNEDGLEISREAGLEDLISLHPKCGICQNKRGIHGRDGELNVFCQIWNRPVRKDGYCNNHK